MERDRVIQLFFFAFLALMAFELYKLLVPFMVPILWATLLAFVFHPLLLAAKRFLSRRSTAALLITLTVALGVILPALWLSTLLAGEAQALYLQISALVAKGGIKQLEDWALHSPIAIALNKMLGPRGIRLEEQIPQVALAVAKYTSDVMVAEVTGVARNLLAFFVDFGIMLITLFYLLRDGEDYYDWVRSLTPLAEEDKRAVFDSLGMTLSSVMRGLLLTSIAQGVLFGTFYFAFGIPYWAFLALTTAACGLLPIGGTALVWVPAGFYLLYAHGWGRALGLWIVGLVAVAVIDNFIKPVVMKQHTGLSTLALFFGIAGGLQAYGALGLFAGPAIIAVFAALLMVYRKTYGVSRREAA